MEYKYDAFISYSRKDSDFVHFLHRNIERNYHKLDKRFRSKKKNVLIALDKEDLGASESLTEEIKDKITSSKHFILICSRASSKSEWVNQEISFFKGTRTGEKNREIIVILYDLPESVSENDFPFELIKEGNIPLYIEARKSVLREKNTDFIKHLQENVLLYIYSVLLSIDYTDLKDRQRMYRKRVFRQKAALFSATIILLLLTFAIVVIQAIKPKITLLKKVPSPLSARTFSPALALYGESMIAKGHDNGSVYLIDNNGNLFDSLPGLTGMVMDVEVFQDTILVGGSLESPDLLFWNLTNSKIIKKFTNPEAASFISIATDADNNKIAVGDENGSVFLIEEDTMRKLVTPDSLGWGRIEDLDFFPLGNKLAFSYLDGPIGYYDFERTKAQFLEEDTVFISEMNFSIKTIKNSLVYSNWANGFNKYYLIKSDLEGNLITLANATAPFNEIHPVANTENFIVSTEDGNIYVFDLAEEEELASTKISYRENYFDGNFFPTAYADKSNLLCAYTNNGIYYFSIDWETIFAIQTPKLKFLSR